MFASVLFSPSVTICVRAALPLRLVGVFTLISVLRAEFSFFDIDYRNVYEIDGSLGLTFVALGQCSGDRTIG